MPSSRWATKVRLCIRRQRGRVSTPGFRLGVSRTACARCDRRWTTGRRGRTYSVLENQMVALTLLRRRQQCLRMINDKFPGSPRVDCLTGIRMEATETPDIALKYYAELLEADPTNAVRGGGSTESMRYTILSRPYGSAAFRYLDVQARSTRRFTNYHSSSTRSIPTSKAGSSWPTFTPHPTSRFPSFMTSALTLTS